MSARDLLARATQRLTQAGIPDPARDARRLFQMAYTRGAETTEPQTRDMPNTRTRELFESALTQRLSRKPVSQIIGYRAFWKHDFHVTADVLDPRPETELLVELSLAGPFQQVLDLGVGSGAILLSLLAERPAAHGLGVDISAAALSVAQRNAQNLAVQDRVQFRQGNWLDELDGQFDLIVSNPPYIAADELDALAPEIRDHEPQIALSPGPDGLAVYRVLATRSPPYLTKSGRLLAEIGWQQGPDVLDIFTQAGWRKIRLCKDLNGLDRVLVAQIC